jgi:hypothetical protein
MLALSSYVVMLSLCCLISGDNIFGCCHRILKYDMAIKYCHMVPQSSGFILYYLGTGLNFVPRNLSKFQSTCDEISCHNAGFLENFLSWNVFNHPNLEVHSQKLSFDVEIWLLSDVVIEKKLTGDVVIWKSSHLMLLSDVVSWCCILKLSSDIPVVIWWHLILSSDVAISCFHLMCFSW